MKQILLICGVTAFLLPASIPATEFPLEFKTLTAAEAITLPTGMQAALTRGKTRVAISNEPPSTAAVYAVLGDAESGRIAFRADESKGPGTGFDRLIVDMNQNGDLTDDAVVGPVEQGKPKAGRQNQVIFGPIPVPEGKRIGDWRPIYYAHLILYSPSGSTPVMGLLRCQPGWYVQTTVDIDGAKERIGVIDGNCNVALGDPSPARFSRSGSTTNWYFRNADYLIRNLKDGAPANDAMVPFSRFASLAGKPCRIMLAADQRSLSAEPWPEPLAELSVECSGGELAELQFGWESAPGKWELLEPQLANRTAHVPAGRYELYLTQIRATNTAGEVLGVGAYRSTPGGSVTFAGGASAVFKCGAPLEIRTTVRKETAPSPGSLLSALLGTGNSRPSHLRIEGEVFGTAGESYLEFQLTGNGKTREPAKPTFTVKTSDGREVGSGNLEYG